MITDSSGVYLILTFMWESFLMKNTCLAVICYLLVPETYFSSFLSSVSSSSLVSFLVAFLVSFPFSLHSHVGGIPLRLRSLSVVGVASRIKSASEQRSVSPPPTTADQRNKCCIQAPHRDRKSEFQLSCQMFVSGVTKKLYFLCCNVTKYFYSVLQCKLEVLEYFY